MNIGLDMSLAATGLAILYPPCHLLTCPRWKPEAITCFSERRLKRIRDWIMEHIPDGSTVTMEGLSFGSRGKVDELAGLHWYVRVSLLQRDIRFYVCPPATLKLFTTGKGNAEKSMMLREVYRRWNVEAADDNQADAAALAYLGACLVGAREPENEAQRRAVASILTPKVKKPKKKEAAA